MTATEHKTFATRYVRELRAEAHGPVWNATTAIPKTIERICSPMDIIQAMYERHTVRSYTSEPIAPAVVKKLQERIAQDNAAFDVDVRLMTDDASAFNVAIKLVLAKGVRNCLILAGSAAPDVDERLGYVGADLMLYAQTLGLNSWWVGGTFRRKAMEEKVPGKKVIGVIALGYGATQGKPHKSKPAAAVSSYDGLPVPVWFTQGVDAALLAPTALNRQAFTIHGRGDAVRITCGAGTFSGADCGIVKYHFEQGAGKGSFRWDEG